MFRGFATLCLLALLGFGALYFFSDVFRGKVDEAVRQKTTWTDERIAEDPAGYLEWAREELGRAESQARARRVTINRLESELSRRKASLDIEVDQQAELLEASRTVYGDALRRDAWPVSLRGFEMTKEQLGEKLLEIDDKLTRTRARVERTRKHLADLSKDLKRTDAFLADVTGTREDLRVQLQRVKLSQDLQSLDDIKATMRVIGDGNFNAELPSFNEDEISVDDLLARSAESNREARILEILNR